MATGWESQRWGAADLPGASPVQGPRAPGPKMSYMPAPEHPATSPGTSKYPHPREGQLWEHIISTLINVLLSSHTLLTRSSYKPLNTLIPQYLSDLLQPYTQSWMLRSSATGLLSVPRTSLHTFGYRVVRLEATTLCNSSISASQRSVTGILQKTSQTHVFTKTFCSSVKHSWVF